MLNRLIKSHLQSIHHVLPWAALTVAFLCPVVLGRGGEQCRRASLIQQTQSANTAESAKAIQALRAEGQVSVDALCAEYDRLIAAGSSPDSLKHLRTVIDAVAKQRDAHASHLYWYTDLGVALKLAQATKRPVLSLRLLGNLDEDLSCANSRFFRSVLYANTEVSQYLRDHYVLHWQSLRPVPRITIDMGDGRQIKRTITGNSIHYVLDSHGEMIDAIPGLQSPAAFLKNLRAANDAAIVISQLNDGDQRRSSLRQYHQASIEKINDAWLHDIDRLADASRMRPTGAGQAAARPAALAAAPIGSTKMRAERPVLEAMFVNAGTPPATLSDEDSQAWEQLAALHTADSAMDHATIALMREKAAIQKAKDAGRLSVGKGFVEDPFIKMLRTFQHSLAADTVRNEYVIHRRIHEWLIAEDPSTPVEAFNQRVYAELFLSPLDDPWMGLAPADVYSALDQNGLAMRCE